MAAEKLVGALFPPKEGSAEAVAWRWKVWATLMALVSVVSFHIAADKGLIRGVDGVAHAADVRGIESRLNSLEEKQNVALRLQLAAEICRVWRQRQTETGAATRAILDNAFDRLQEDYASVNRGFRYSVGECSRRNE